MVKRLEAFCRAHNIPMDLTKRWFTPQGLYYRANNEYHKKIRKVYDAYVKMTELYRTYYHVYTQVVESFGNEYSSNIMLHAFPEIDFSNLDGALHELNEEICLLQEGKAYGAYEYLLRDQNEALFDYRHNFIQKAISDLPKEKNVVIITTGISKPASTKREFWDEVKAMAKKPSNRRVYIGTDDYYEWVAFCPRQMRYNDLYFVFDLWKGDPRYATVHYR